MTHPYFPDLRDDEAVRVWFLDNVYGETTQAAATALRRLVRHYAERVATEACYWPSRAVKMPSAPYVRAALDAILGPERGEPQ